MESPSPSYSSVRDRNSWTPGFFRRLPWLGLAAIVGAVLGMIASIAILVSADGKPVSDWRYPPTVYLSISYTITNILLAAALSQGVTIAWWNKALRESTQLSDLHHVWDFGHSPLAAIFAGRNFNFLALAALLVAITPVNGPLLQRAASVVTQTVTTSPQLSLATAQDIYYPTGLMSHHAVSVLTDVYNPTVQSYYNGDEIAANNTGCAGDAVCSGRLAAAGWAVNCSSYTAPFDAELDPNDTQSNYTNDGAVIGVDVFQSYFTWSHYLNDQVGIDIQYKDKPQCAGELVVKNCSLYAATVQYPVLIDGNKSTISLDPQTTIFDDVVVSKTDYGYQPEGGPTRIGGYAYALQNRYTSTAYLYFAGPWDMELLTSGPTSAQFATGVDELKYSGQDGGFCNITFRDPSAFMLRQARELMFRSALAGGNSSNIQSLVSASQQQTVAVYRSHYLFLGLGVAITLISVLIVLMTFNGYWRLGRKMTLSPLETAKAFNAPLLAAVDSNADVKTMLDQAGSMPVQYGLVIGGSEQSPGVKKREVVHVDPVDAADSRRLEITHPAHVRAL